VWSHGNAYWQREAAIPAFMAGQRADLPEVHVQYALVGPVERALYSIAAPPADWRLLAEQGAYKLYALPGM
jgi:hypothetical protein